MVESYQMGILEELGSEIPSRCSVGEPRGDFSIGFEGWGDPDVLVDPAIPLDMQFAQLGLEGRFEVVESHGLLHLLHGDCVLTHGVRGIVNLARPGGKVKFEYLSLHDGIREATKRLDMGDFVSAQAVEKTCFAQALDTTGVLYPQTLISIKKMTMLLRGNGCSKIKITKEVDASSLPLFPDHVLLDGVEDKVWEASTRNFTMRDSLDQDRPSCILCNKVATRRDHDRQFFSRYCKNHYQEAREECDLEMREAFLVRMKARRSK